MTSSDDSEADRIQRALRTFNALMEHAEHYKALFHDTQEKLHAAQDELAARGRMIRWQRKTIAELETRCGIDQEL